MKPYGMKRRDRIKCSIKGCGCGDSSSKHPQRINTDNFDRVNRRLKKHNRQEGKREVRLQYAEYAESKDCAV